MTIAIRDLLYRVKAFFPDATEAVALGALEDAAKDVARETGLGRETLVPVSLPVGTKLLTVTPSTGNVLRRVEQVRIPNIPYNSTLVGKQYKGVWNATTNTPDIGAASAGNKFEWYLVTTAGTTDKDGITSWAVGDIVINYTTEWQKITLEEYFLITEVNQPSSDLTLSQPQKQNAFPARFSQENGVLKFFPPTQTDTAIQLKLQIIPTGEVETVAFPQSAVNALVYYALEFMYQLPGKNQNLAMSAVYHRRYLIERAELRSIAEIGDAGSPFYVPANFGGRTGRNSPWRSENYWI